MANPSQQIEDKDLELLNKYSILRIAYHQEKLVKFKITKKKVYRQFAQVNSDTFLELETKIHSREGIIETLKNIIDSYTHNLSRYVALAEALNSEAIKKARLALSLVAIPPDTGVKKPNLTLIKT